jgi:hypothetical protein
MADTKYIIEHTADGQIKGLSALNESCKQLSTGKWCISITKHRKSRTSRQNAFYFGNFLQSQIDCIKEYWGETYTKEQIHEWNKTKFWGQEHLIEATGEIIYMPGSSTTNNTVEWEERLENCRQWFRQTFSWELPYPNQQSEIEL